MKPKEKTKTMKREEKNKNGVQKKSNLLEHVAKKKVEMKKSFLKSGVNKKNKKKKKQILYT